MSVPVPISVGIVSSISTQLVPLSIECPVIRTRYVFIHPYAVPSDKRFESISDVNTLNYLTNIHLMRGWGIVQCKNDRW